MSIEYQNEHNAALQETSDRVIAQLPECAKLFFRDLRDTYKSEKTIYQYAYDIYGFFSYLKEQPSFKDVDFNSLKIEDILDKLEYEDLLEYLESFDKVEIKEGKNKGKKKKASPSYIARKKASLKSFYNFYFKKRMIKTNPASLIDNTKIGDKNILVLETSEIDRFLSLIEPSKDTKRARLLASRDKAIVCLLLKTGMRVSELVGTDLSDVDINSATISIMRKGGNEDQVFFSGKLEEIILDYINNTRKEMLDGASCPALFVSMQKERMTVSSIEKMMKTYKNKAGEGAFNKKITPHTLRRTCGTYLYNETGDIYLVADQLGHKSIETTKKHYAKLNENKKRNAAKVLDDMF